MPATPIGELPFIDEMSAECENTPDLVDQTYTEDINAIVESQGLDEAARSELATNIINTLDSFSLVGISPKQVIDSGAKLGVRMRDHGNNEKAIVPGRFEILVQPPLIPNALIDTSLKLEGNRDDYRLQHEATWYLNPVEYADRFKSEERRLDVINESFFERNRVPSYDEPMNLYSKFNFPANGKITTADIFNKSFRMKFRERNENNNAYNNVITRDQLTYRYDVNGIEDEVIMQHREGTGAEKSHSTSTNPERLNYPDPEYFVFNIHPGVVEWFARTGQNFDLSNFFPSNGTEVEYVEVYGNRFPIPMNLE